MSGFLGGPVARNGTSFSRPDRGKSQMWGMGNRSEPTGPDETSERSLFKVLEAKNANRSASAGSVVRLRHRSSGRKALWLFAVAAVIAAAFVVIPFASSANPDISGFELDGNVVDGAGEPATTGRRCSTRADSPPATAAPARRFSSPMASAPPTPVSPVAARRTRETFRTGDGRSASHRQRTTSRTPMRPPTSSSSPSILYFGQERVDTQAGDANMGFWFLQDPTVGPNAAVGFDGKHVDGDVLIQSSLTNGGGVSDIHVFKWGERPAQRGHRYRRGRLHGRQAGHDERLRLREHGDDHAPMGSRI